MIWDKKRVRKVLEGILNTKKNLDRNEREKYINTLKKLNGRCVPVQWKILIKFLLIKHLLNLCSNLRWFTKNTWIKIIIYLNEIIDLLRENTKYRVNFSGDLKLELTKEEKENNNSNRKNILDFNSNHPEGLNPNFKWINGNLLAICYRLYDDLILSYKSLINKQKYSERQEDKKKFVKLLEKILIYSHSLYNSTGEIENYFDEIECRSLIIQLSFEEYDSKFDFFAKLNQNYIPFQIDFSNFIIGHAIGIFNIINNFKKTVFELRNEASVNIFFGQILKIRIETILHITYYIALHNHYLLSLDIFTIMGLGKDVAITKYEISTQILYNRTIARIAIAAFTNENYKQSMNLLRQLYATGKIKELLAQGIKPELRWKNNKTPEEVIQEQKEKNRMVPDHTFINQDLLESVHFISSLFFEINAILNTYNKEKQVANPSFRRQWDFRNTRDFLTFPENTRETILEAGFFMMKGNWKQCINLLDSLKFWEYFNFSEKIKIQIFFKIKSECLRCYLISCSKNFSDTLLIKLSEKFNFSITTVAQLCSSFINDRDFKGSVNFLQGLIIIHQPLLTKFETSIILFQEKIAVFSSSLREMAEIIGIQHKKKNIKQKGKFENPKLEK